MKTTLLLSACWLFFAGLFLPHKDQSALTGIVKDDKEPLVGASVKVYMGTALVRGAVTDIEGRYKILLAPGTYDVEFSYTGYQSEKVTGVVVLEGKIATLDATLHSHVLNEVVITSYKVPLIEKDKTSGGQTITSEQIKNLPTRSVSAKAETSKAKKSGSKAPGKPVDAGDIKIKGARDHAEEPAIAPKPALTTPAVDAPADDIVIGADGRKKRVVIPFDAETYEEKVVLIDVEDGTIYSGPAEAESADAVDKTDKTGETEPGTIPQPAPRAGLLTAGEWNDLHNWDRHWVDLLNDGEIASYENMYGFYPEHRYTVLLTNDHDVPVPDAPVQLKSNGEIVWETRTDNTGKAELWAGIYDKKEYTNLTAEAWVNGQKYEIKSPKAIKNGYNFLKINTECDAPKNVDIVWAVDATGSMGDELEYLKTELLDVISRVQRNNPALNIRMGTTFYRDQGDEYVVRPSSLSPDIHQTVDFIRAQYAAGGGDYPEAVHSALEEVMYKQPWSENAIARICFLVLDASPHNNPEVNASLQKSIREAAKRGIRIVPLTASGIQKDTEFLMKFFGLATNGTYLFLTDHSGIGGKHLEPTTDEYKVEALNDLLVRIITEYTSIESCEGKSNIRFENDPQQQPGQVFEASYYPNPAADRFTLELPIEVQTVTLYDSEGKAVRKLEKPVAGANIIQVNDLAPGFYTIRILSNGRMQSGKLMVIRS